MVQHHNKLKICLVYCLLWFDVLINNNSKQLVAIQLWSGLGYIRIRWRSGSGQIQSLWIRLRSGSGRILKYGIRCTPSSKIAYIAQHMVQMRTVACRYFRNSSDSKYQLKFCHVQTFYTMQCSYYVASHFEVLPAHSLCGGESSISYLSHCSELKHFNNNIHAVLIIFCHFSSLLLLLLYYVLCVWTHIIK